jgi:hypothetical protein
LEPQVLTQKTTKKVLWVHNYAQGAGGTFMYDILQAGAWDASWEVSEFHVPLQPTLFQIFELIRNLRKASKEVDLVHAQYGSVCGLIACFSVCPKIVSIRGSDFYVAPSFGLRNKMLSVLRSLFTRITLNLVDCIICMSQRNKCEIENLYFFRTPHIYHICDPAGLEFWAPLMDHVPKKDVESPLRVFCSSLRLDSKIKRLYIISEAADMCRNIGINIELVNISGKPRSEIVEQLESCDLIALASTHEGWPNAVKEALLLGKTYIATDVSDLKAFASKTGLGEIADPNPVSFAIKFVDVYYQKKWKLSDKAKSFAEFHPTVTARKLQLVYNALVSQHK